MNKQWFFLITLLLFTSCSHAPPQNLLQGDITKPLAKPTVTVQIFTDQNRNGTFDWTEKLLKRSEVSLTWRRAGIEPVPFSLESGKVVLTELSLNEEITLNLTNVVGGVLYGKDERTLIGELTTPSVYIFTLTAERPVLDLLFGIVVQ